MMSVPFVLVVYSYLILILEKLFLSTVQLSKYITLYGDRMMKSFLILPTDASMFYEH